MTTVHELTQLLDLLVFSFVIQATMAERVDEYVDEEEEEVVEEEEYDDISMLSREVTPPLPVLLAARGLSSTHVHHS